MPRITLNGEPKEIAAASPAELLLELGLGQKQAAVEINRVIIPRSQHGDTPIRDGDEVEVISFVGGG
ncbi:sulfur carrier protein ThiS [bacterium]|nr:sulfur carrier protein ThiS [bacterium]